MKLTIENIGKLKHAEVEINGITVITGENDTGKSTVGKALWSIFIGLYKIPEQVSRQRKESIKEILMEFRFKIRRKKKRNEVTVLERPVELVEEINRNIEILKNNSNALKDKLVQFLEIEEVQETDELVSELQEAFKISNEEIEKRIVQNILKREFNDKINNIHIKETGKLVLNVKKEELKVTVKDNSVETLEYGNYLNNEAVYIDNPDIIDKIGTPFGISGREYGNHRNQLIKKLNDSFLINLFTEKNVITEIITENKLKNIQLKLNGIIKVSFTRKNGGIFYKEKEDDEELNVKSLSMGMKMFSVLKLLIENGVLKEKGTIILDEPEIHLHPEWQLKFAELIVLLQKDFGMHILLTTHSPYFVSAIEVYSEKYEIDERCKYYVAKNIENISIIEDITSNTSEIFEKMARPFQDLENIRYSYDDSE